jgi:hypothetical protein
MTETEPAEGLTDALLARVRAESAPTLKRRLMRRMRSALSTIPALYIPLRRRRRADTVAGPETEFILEGYPRCGNTWAEMAIRHAATRPLKMAHHSHAAAHVSYGLGLGIPTLVLFREPDQAVRSLLAMNARNLTAADAYREYLRFYEAVLALPRDRLMFASFEDVTLRIDRVIQALRDRFALPVEPFDPQDKAQEAAVFARMDARAAVIRSDGQAVSRSNPNHFDAEQLALKRLAQEQIAAVRDGGLYRATMQPMPA